jgi:hypothetical protein
LGASDCFVWTIREIYQLFGRRMQLLDDQSTW